MMKRKRFIEEQIIRALKEYEGGRTTKEVCWDLGISSATFYSWRKKYAGMEVSQFRKLKELETENRSIRPTNYTLFNSSAYLGSRFLSLLTGC